MGGLALASGKGAVFTPRMRPSVYHAVLDQCKERLRELYVVVAAPIEGPAKTSYGDIDLFLAWPRKDASQHTRPTSPALSIKSIKPPKDPKEEIYQVLGAIRSKSENSFTTSMAIPWPEDMLHGVVKPERKDATEGLGNDAKPDDILTSSPCIQVDVHICHTLEHLQWMLFKCTHGDFWNIIGSMIRPIGLTIDEKALHVRIPEIEEQDRKKARILLSDDPFEILSFLGLASNGKQWEEPFASDEDLFEYAATCRLFTTKPPSPPTGTEGRVDAENEDSHGAAVTAELKLKSNDRRRMTYRPLFRKWVNEYLPAYYATRQSNAAAANENDPPSQAPVTRDTVREDAFAHFPGTRELYNSRLIAWRVERQRQTLWNQIIKPSVRREDPSSADNKDKTADHRYGCGLAALKKIILNGDTSYGDIVAPPTLRLKGNYGRDDEGNERVLFDEDAVRVWVKENWQRVADVAWEMQLLRAREKSKTAPPKRTASGSRKPSPDAAVAVAVGSEG